MAPAAALPSVDALASNILDVYRWGERTHRSALRWYDDAHAEAVRMADAYGVDLTVAVGVIAALSPRLAWDLNLRHAATFLATGDAPVLGHSKRSAARIVAGEDPLSVLKGPKVRSFYSNILDPAGSDAVTIDRHAFDVAMGQRGSDATRGLLTRAGAYGLFVEAYRLASEQIGQRASAVQSLTWEAWREIVATRKPTAATV